MKSIKKILAPVSMLFFLAASAVGSVQAASSSTVTATVTVQNVSVSLSESSFNYGTLGQNSTGNTLGLFSGAGIVATNDGNVAADLNISGANTSNWTLGATASTDQYVHKFCNDTDNDCTLPGGAANYTALTTSPQTLKSSVAAAGTAAFQLQINTPNPSTVYDQQSVGVTIQISAS